MGKRIEQASKKVQNSDAWVWGETILWSTFIITAGSLSLSVLGRIKLEDTVQDWMARILGGVALVTFFWMMKKANERRV